MDKVSVEYDENGAPKRLEAVVLSTQHDDDVTQEPVSYTHLDVYKRQWYSGTANAIYQNMKYIDSYNPEYVLILSGEDVYKRQVQENHRPV